MHCPMAGLGSRRYHVVASTQATRRSRQYASGRLHPRGLTAGRRRERPVLGREGGQVEEEDRVGDDGEDEQEQQGDGGAAVVQARLRRGDRVGLDVGIAPPQQRVGRPRGGAEVRRHEHVRHIGRSGSKVAS